jgi:hypothetical protein
MKLPAYRPPSNAFEPQTTIGRIVRVKRGMQPPAKTACAECPLRKDAKPGYLGGYTPEMYVEVLHGPASLACHLANSGPVDTQRHCVGVCAYRANVGHRPTIEGHLTSAMDAIEVVGKDPQFFESPKAFLDHHHGRKKR